MQFLALSFLHLGLKFQYDLLVKYRSQILEFQFIDAVL